MKLTDAKTWRQLRDSALPPLNVSKLTTTATDRREFVEGARLLRFHGDTARPGHTAKPQQLLTCDVLATGHKLNGILLPRRSSKSTSLIAVALGRAAARDDYRVGILTLTSGKAGRSRFLKDVAPAIERVMTATYGSDRKVWPLHIVRSAGQERVEFRATGGMVAWLSSVDDLRGEAFDLVILDEAGEAEPEKVSEVVSAALPTTDTRPGGQLVAAGTGGRYRDGNLLWDWLELGRTDRAGILEYAMPDETDIADLGTWDAVEPLVIGSHPGVGTLTTLDSIRGNFDASLPEDFAREYGGIFGTRGDASRLFDLGAWALAGEDGPLPSPPDRFSLAFACHPDGVSTSILAAWRDPEGRAVPLLIDQLPGIDKAAPRLIQLARRYRVPIVYDSGSQNAQVIVERLSRANPKPKLEPKEYRHVKQAATLIVDDVNRGNVHWYSTQAALNEAVLMARKRRSGDRVWLIGRDPKRPDDDVTPVEAWALALLDYDTTKPKSRSRGRMAA